MHEQLFRFVKVVSKLEGKNQVLCTWRSSSKKPNVHVWPRSLFAAQAQQQKASFTQRRSRKTSAYYDSDYRLLLLHSPLQCQIVKICLFKVSKTLVFIGFNKDGSSTKRKFWRLQQQPLGLWLRILVLETRIWVWWQCHWPHQRLLQEVLARQYDSSRNSRTSRFFKQQVFIHHALKIDIF